MNILKKFYELMREGYGPFFPTSKKKKEAFLDKVREKVNNYKPKIEEICQVNLGDIDVKDFEYLISDLTIDMIQKRLQEYRERTGKELSEFGIILNWSSALVGETIARPFIWCFTNLWGYDMKYYNSSIYVLFYFQNRFMDIDFERRKKTLDQCVVHELSHGLWYALDGENNIYDKERNFWSEGFASYCANIYFTNLYPSEIKTGTDTYKKQREKIEELVREQGKDIILEVPRRWREFKEKEK